MRYFVFEGPDGSGKTTLLHKVKEHILTTWMNDTKYTVETTRSPGQTKLGQRLRSIVLDEELDVDFLSRQILFMADTVNYYETYLKPRIEENSIILQDRSSYVSSLIYGMSDGLAYEPLARMLSIYKPIMASKLFVLTTSPEICHQRRLNGSSQNVYDVKPIEFYRSCCKYYNDILSDSRLRLVISEFVHLDNVVYIDSSDLDEAVPTVAAMILKDMPRVLPW